jgi:hypothetical protein
MNAHLTKTLTLWLLLLSTLAGPLRAQDTNLENGNSSPGRRGTGHSGTDGNSFEFPMFNIQIENGKLSLAVFKDTPAQNPFGTNAASVPATINNLSKYLRAIDPDLNIILSPDVGDLTIANLKLSTRNLASISEAFSVASGGVIRASRIAGGGGGFGGPGADRSLTFVTGRSQDQSSVEIFNLSGYVQTLGKVSDDMLGQKIDELHLIVQDTLHQLHKTDGSPSFQFHRGTKLLIVIGKPEDLAVTRKIIDALPGQQSKDQTLDTPRPAEQK